MKKIISNLLLFIISVCCTISLFINVTLSDLEYAINGWGIPQAMILALFYFLFRKYIPLFKKNIDNNHNIIFANMTLSILFSFFMIIGKYFQANKELKFFALTPILIIGYFTIFFLALSFLYHKIITLKENLTMARYHDLVFEKRPILFPAFIIFLFRLPYLIAFYPCTISWDGADQFSQTMGYFPFTDWHPPFGTLLYGVVTRIGITTNTPNQSVYVFIIFQTIITTLIFAYSFKLLKYLKTPYLLRWGVLLYYSLFTIFSIYSVTIEKDAIYYPIVLLYSLLLIELVLHIKQNYTVNLKRLFLLFSTSILLMSLIRYNGIFVFILSFPFLIFIVPKRQKIGLILYTLLIIVSIQSINHLIITKTDIYEYDFLADKYVVLIQQTGRYSQKHPEDVTPDEYNTLNKIFDYAKLQKEYDPQLADWARNTIRIDAAGNSNLKKYFDQYLTIWIQQFKRHPITYIESFFASSYGYYYPELPHYKEGVGVYDNDTVMLSKYIFPIYFIDKFEAIRNILEELTRLQRFPLISLFYSCGFYTWVIAWVTLLILYLKKYSALILVAPTIVNILVCLVSPVNPYIRYCLPTFVSTPVLVCMAVYYIRKQPTVADSDCLTRS